MMIKKQAFVKIEKKLKGKISSCTILRKSDSSEIFLIKLKDKRYIIKKGLGTSKNIVKEFNNHKKIYSIYRKFKKNLLLSIPRVYFLDKKANFYLMEYLDADNLQELIFKKDFIRLKKIFYKLGRALSNYHDVITSTLKPMGFSFLEHNTIRSVLKSEYDKYMDLYHLIPNSSYKIIFKDLKATNILVDAKDQIYFVDFQNIYYYGPFYYDLARFIDTTKVFSFIGSPFYYILNKKKMNDLFSVFVRAYDKNVSMKILNNAQKLHQLEHIYMKKDRGQIFNSFVLKIIYKIGV